MTDIHEIKLAEHELKRHRDPHIELVRERTRAQDARVDAEGLALAADANRQSSSRPTCHFTGLRTPIHAIINAVGVEGARRQTRQTALLRQNIQAAASYCAAFQLALLDIKLGRQDAHEPCAIANRAAARKDVIGESGLCGFRQVRFAIRIDEAVEHGAMGCAAHAGPAQLWFRRRGQVQSGERGDQVLRVEHLRI